MYRIAFFDAKPYDIASFTAACDRRAAVGEECPEIKYYETKLTADTVGLAAGADVACVFVNDTVDAAVIDRLCETGCRLIALRCAGYNNVDVEYAFGRIHVVRVPAYSPHAVAEHAMAMLMTSIRRIHKAYIRTRDFNFSLNGLTGFDLYGKTVGIVGTGRIGRCFADICHGFGMKILAYDKFPAPDFPGTYVSLDRLFAESDILSLHCPLTDETHHMIGAESLAKMKRGVVIVNTSRGALIDAEALLAAIKARHVGAACLDVYEEESDLFFRDFSGHILDDDVLARLISMPNVIVTSHQAFLTEEALAGIAATTLGNVNAFFRDGACENELCYRCGRIEDCRRERAGKCF